MSEGQRPEVDLRAWAEGDLALEMRLLGDPAMTEYIGGPESLVCNGWVIDLFGDA